MSVPGIALHARRVNHVSTGHPSRCVTCYSLGQYRPSHSKGAGNSRDSTFWREKRWILAPRSRVWSRDAEFQCRTLRNLGNEDEDGGMRG
eukprot:1996639-Rhodomonas_salina.1